MTYDELITQAKEIYKDVDASHIDQHIAFQFNITGEAEGAFYLEIADGKVNVEPYEYYDRDVLITTSEESLLKIALGQLDPVHAYLTGKIKVEGDLDKALKLKELSVKPKEKKKACGRKKKA